MILLWGMPSDPPLAAVEKILLREQLPYCFLDQRAIMETALTLEVGEQVGGTLTVRGDRVGLDQITAVYPRPYPPEQIGSVASAGSDSAEFRHAASFHEAMSIWLDLTPAMVPNRPREMALNYSKPYQSALIAAAGFAIPETLLTTDPAAAIELRRAHGEIIYKSVSAMRSIVARLGPGDDARLGDIGFCPTQFQQCITGTELRVHVVGDAVFAAEIVSAADDYRYAALTGDTCTIRAFDLAPDCAEQCRKLTRALGFVLAGIDLRHQDGIWYCFEANPSPGFTYYQEQTGQPIDEAVARLLAVACRAPASQSQ